MSMPRTEPMHSHVSDTHCWAAALVGDLGRPQFHSTLLTGLREAVRADHVTQLSYGRDGQLVHAFAASLINQSLIDQTTDLYVNHSFYQRDPNYARLQDLAAKQGSAQEIQLLDVTAHHIPDAEYRRVLFDEPGFVSKVALMSVTAQGMSYLNLYFSEPAHTGVNSWLMGRSSLLSALTLRHQQLVSQLGTSLSSATALEHAPAWHQALSARERQVAQLMHQGCTAKEIGKQLQLSPATIVTYKNRLFEKSGVANLKGFLAQSSRLFH